MSHDGCSYCAMGWGENCPVHGVKARFGEPAAIAYSTCSKCTRRFVGPKVPERHDCTVPQSEPPKPASYRMDEHVDPPFHVGPRALEIYRERLGVKDGVFGEYESAVLQVAHYAFNEGLAARPKENS